MSTSTQRIAVYWPTLSTLHKRFIQHELAYLAYLQMITDVYIGMLCEPNSQYSNQHNILNALPQLGDREIPLTENVH